MASSLLIGCGENLRTVEDKLTAAWERHRTITGNVTIDYRNEHKGGTTRGQAEGTYELLRKGGKSLLRLETTYESTTTIRDRTVNRRQHLTVVSDGEYTYTLSDAIGDRTVLKNKAGSQPGFGPKALFGMLAGLHKLELLPRENVDGHSVYVIEGTPREKDAVPFAKVRYYYRPDGILLRQVNFNADGEPIHTAAFTDVKLNVQLDPDRFVFKPPPGAKVLEPTTRRINVGRSTR